MERIKCPPYSEPPDAMLLGIARPASRYASPKIYTSPSPYREYFSYPAEGKASLSRRKKHLHVVEFFYLCT